MIQRCLFARYQVKGNRPSGKLGSFVNLVPKAYNYDWDFRIWILYNSRHEIQEACLWFERYFQMESDDLRTIYGKTRGAKKALKNFSASQNDKVLKLKE